jgi:molybdopterin converting factor small subunit
MAKVTIKIPAYFQPFSEWNSELVVDAKTTGGVLEALLKTYPQLRPHFYTHWGILSANILFYLNEDEIFSLQGMETPVKDGDRFLLVPTASGG